MGAVAKPAAFVRALRQIGQAYRSFDLDQAIRAAVSENILVGPRTKIRRLQ
jgi:hypothetical protein